MNSLLQDLRYALRTLAKNPGFTLVAAVTLALGIGANGAIFSLGNALLLRPIAAPHPQELVRLYETVPEGRRTASHSYLNFRDYREQTQTLAGLAAESNEGLVMTSEGQTYQLLGGVVSGNYFDMLGLRPAAGRFFRPDEDQPGAGRVVVLGYRFWQKRFGGKPETVGSTVVLNNETFMVIGIAPQEFSADFAGLFLDVWVPINQAARWIGTGWMEDRESPKLALLGRRKSGVTLAQAAADLNAISSRLLLAYPRAGKAGRILIEQARFFDAGLRGSVMTFLTLMLAMAGLVLLTACANLANFFLVRASARRREMAVRTALGADRWRLVRQVYAETMCVAALGGSLGMLVAAWLSGWLGNSNPFPPSIPVALDLTPDYRVYLYTLAVTLLAGAFLGLAPARQATRTGVLVALKDEAGGVIGGASRVRAAFVAAQVALSLVLLIGAGLFMRSLQNAARMNFGFAPAHVLAMDIDTGLKNWSDGRATQYYRDVLQRVESLPGVRSATVVNLMPLDIATPRFGVIVEGQQAQGRDPIQVSMNRVGLRYFETLQIPLVSGRDFREDDRLDAPGAVIVNQTMVARFWPGKDPLGQRFQLAPGKAGKVDVMTGGKWVSVIGVARDVKYRTLGEEPEAHMYLPYAQHFAAQRTLVVQTAGEPGPMMQTVQNELRAVDPELAGFFARTAEQHMVLAFLPARMAAALSAGFGALALALATLGLYGVVAWSVAQRTREIGIRMALGAARGDVLRLVVGHGMKMVAGGVALGLVAAWALSRFLGALLYGVSATDPLVFAGFAMLLLGVASAASYLPARRAARLDPLRALRHN